LNENIIHPTAVILAQARRSSPSERSSRLGELVSSEWGSNSGKNKNLDELSLRLSWFA